jgi:prepilin-type N-terminal cleavage/methylation domain-containing protein
MDQPIRRRRGMTLVELLVVVAVLAALVALLLPAVQAAREAARRAACMNNLRHIGCALHGHLLAKRAFPVGCLEFKSGKGGTKRCLAWSAQILPWLEESATAERLRYDLPYDHADNRPAGSAPLGVFVCPAADRIGLLVDGLGRTDYGGIAGERIVSAPLAVVRSAGNPRRALEDAVRRRMLGRGVVRRTVDQRPQPVRTGLCGEFHGALRRPAEYLDRRRTAEPASGRCLGTRRRWRGALSVRISVAPRAGRRLHAGRRRGRVAMEW